MVFGTVKGAGGGGGTAVDGGEGGGADVELGEGVEFDVGFVLGASVALGFDFLGLYMPWMDGWVSFWGLEGGTLHVICRENLGGVGDLPGLIALPILRLRSFGWRN